MKKPKFWQTLEVLPDGAALAEWALELGNEFERARPWLQPTPDEAKTYPCTSRPRCECRHHRVEPLRNGDRVAVCDCGDCAPIRLTVADLTLHELNRTRLAEALTRLGGWRQTPMDPILPGVWTLGRWNDLRATLYWCAGGRADRLRRMVDSLFALDASPFILVLPTRTSLTTSLDAALRREGCCALPLEEHLTVENNGEMKLVESMAGIGEEFEQRSAHRDTAKMLRGIHEKIEQAERRKPEPVATIPPPPKFLIRQDASRRRAGRNDRTAVSTWRIWFNGHEVLLPTCVGAEYLIFLITRQGKEFNASAFTEAVRKSSAAVAVAGADVNAILYGSEMSAPGDDNQRGRVGDVNERDVIWNKDQIASAIKNIKGLLEEKKDHEKANDFSSSAYVELKGELENWQDLLSHNAKQVNGKWVSKEYQKGTAKEKAELIGKHLRKLLNSHLRAACRPLYDHLHDKSTLVYGIRNCYRPKPAIQWEFQFKGVKKGT